MLRRLNKISLARNLGFGKVGRTLAFEFRRGRPPTHEIEVRRGANVLQVSQQI